MLIEIRNDSILLNGYVNAIARDSRPMLDDNGEKVEERAFVDFIITGEEMAASPGMSYGSNGAIVPTTIAKKNIEKVKELSPIYEKVEKFSTKGTL